MARSLPQPPMFPPPEAPRTETCLKCGTFRDDERWPFKLVFVSPEVALLRDAYKFVNRLLCSCGRCGYNWSEPAGKIEVAGAAAARAKVVEMREVVPDTDV